MDYYKKYLKYKQKYLQLKNQKGGYFIYIHGTTTHSITIKGISENFKNVENYLKGNVRILKFSHNEKNCYVQFNSHEEAVKQKSNIQVLMDNYNPEITYPDPERRLPERRLPEPRRLAITSSRYDEPWATKNSTRLFIGLILSPERENIGGYLKDIVDSSIVSFDPEYRLYPNYNGRIYTPIYNEEHKNIDPHVSLFTLTLPLGGVIYNFLNNEINFYRFKEFIKDKYNKYIKYQYLASEKGYCQDFGNWIAIDYSYNIGGRTFTKERFDFFLNNFWIDFLKFCEFSESQIKETIIIQEQPPQRESIDTSKKPQTFTHYTNSDVENSFLAISSFTTDFKPHVSIIKKSERLDSEMFKAIFNSKVDETTKAGKPIDGINLWSTRTYNGIGVNGSISHLYVSFYKRHEYIPLD
jgi:hypothetical protein